jgi:signal transduction histidine kinase
MNDDATGRMILEVQEPLRAAFTALTSHSAKILVAWRAQLKRYKPCNKYLALLAGLPAAPQLRDLIFTKPEAYREKAERQGQELSRGGVPPECVAIAMALYVESCLPYLQSGDARKMEWTRAFARWGSIYQYFLLTGYVQHGAVERQSLEDRITQAERRAQDFSVQLGEAYEKERRRLAQDLHDEIGHDLIVLKLYTEVIVLDLKKGDTSQLRRKMKESVALIQHALKSVRHLTFDLGPAVWNEQGFVPAVRLYARQFAERTGIKVRLNAARMRVQLPARCETALYKVLQGALANVVAHADAQSIIITLASGKEAVAMKIQDDGRGFNVARKMGVARQSYGLRAMRERIELLGGVIQFASRPARLRAQCRGTTIEARLPMQESELT